MLFVAKQERIENVERPEIGVHRVLSQSGAVAKLSGV